MLSLPELDPQKLVWTGAADDTFCLLSTTRYWNIQQHLTVLNLSKASQVQQHLHVVVGVEEIQMRGRITILAESYTKGELVVTS